MATHEIRSQLVEQKDCFVNIYLSRKFADLIVNRLMRVSIKYAKIHLSALITRALRGEEIIICRNSIPVARLEPI